MAVGVEGYLEEFGGAGAVAAGAAESFFDERLLDGGDVAREVKPIGRKLGREREKAICGLAAIGGRDLAAIGC